MDAYLFHSGLEMASAVLLAWIATAYRRLYVQKMSPFYLIMMNGFWITALEDMVHAIAAIANHDLIQHWVAWTWGTARLTLGAMFLIACLSSVTRMTIRRAVTISSISWFVSFSLMFFALGADVSFVYADSVVHRPLDLAGAMIWGVIALVVMFNPKVRQEAPPDPSVVIALGIIMHLAMAFGSTEALDDPFMLAHVVKLAEYIGWAYLVRIQLQMAVEVNDEFTTEHDWEAAEIRANTAMRELARHANGRRNG